MSTATSTAASTPTAHKVEDVYPLSPLQQGMLFQSLLHEDSGVYLMQDRYRIGGPLDVDAFMEAWRLVVAAHPALRTSFLWKTQKQPLQIVHKHVDLPVEYIDLRDRTPAEQDAYIQDLLQEEQRTGFNLAKPPLIRFRLVRLDDETHEMVRSFHHILMDAWCISLVMVDCIEAYHALRQGQQPVMRRPRPYRDYIAWLQKQDKTEAQSFWQRQLQGLDAPTPLLVEQAPRQNQYREAVLVDDCLINLDEAQTQAVTHFCQTHRITPNTLFQGAWALLLARYCGNDDVVFGVTVSGRPPELPGVEDMIGLFINTLPLRVSIEEDQAVAPWLQAVQRTNLEMREYEHSALVDIQGWSAFPRGEELFDSILVYENAPFDDRLLSGGLSFRLDNMEHSVHTHYGLTVVVMPWGPLSIRISYDRRRFGRDSIERMLGHLRKLVIDMVARPGASLRSLELLTDDERQQMLIDWNQTHHDFPLEKTYAQLFAEQVAAHPQRIAAICQGEQLTYAKLDARANRIAATLIDAGAGPDRIVGVMAERGLGFLASIIGIFKAGAAYLPLDVKHPPQRLAEILSLSQAPLVLVGEAQAGLADEICMQLPQPPRAFVIETLWDKGAATPVMATGTPADLAYVIFTSGSTGAPKGALVEQRGMLNNIFGKVPTLGLCAQDRIAQTASVAFDISVWQFLAAPLMGASVHILPDEISHDPARLLAAIQEQELTLLEAVPAVIRGMLAASTLGTTLASLRWLLPTGEALPPALCRDWFARFPQVPLMNAYGPAECSDDVAFHPIMHAVDELTQAMPIGRATPNNQLYILDAASRPVPIGVPGEICVAGVGVGRGYLNDPERTRAAFTPHPFQTGSREAGPRKAGPRDAGPRFYRTGDMGRYRADGVIEFLGRRDQQVKIRGHRIELGEVEARLQQLPTVKEAAVIARADSRGEQQLVAYWVKGQEQADASSLREALEIQLPPYMVPAAFVELDALPLNANGKVNRKQLSLRELDWRGGARETLAPRNETEQTLYGIWAEILGLDTFSVDDSFFALGGHSLLATQVVSRIRAAFSVDLPLKTLFDRPTVALLAQGIEEHGEKGSDAALTSIRPAVRPARIPLSFAQQRLWFIEQLNPGTAHFNVPVALRLEGTVDHAALQQSFMLLIERHEVLRTAFLSENGKPYQQIHDAVTFELPVFNVKDQCSDRIPPTLLNWFEEAFDLARPPLLRAQLHSFSDNNHILAITLHHLVSDAWSAAIALRELAQLYAALCENLTPALPPLPIQYADFTLWQRNFLRGETLDRQLSYWKNTLAPRDAEANDNFGENENSGAGYLLNLPTDKPRPAVQSYRSGLLNTQLSPVLSDRIRHFADKQRQSPFSVIMAAFAVLLQRMSGQNDIILGTPVSDRSRIETESLLGILLNNLPIRADFSANPSFAQIARQVSDTLLEAQRHQDLPFEQLVDRLALPRSLSHAPLFQVMVAQQLAVERRVQFPGLSFELLETPLTQSEYDLDLHIVTAPQGPIELEMMYAVDLFEAATAQRWLARFELLLERLLETPDKSVAELPLLTPDEWQQTVVAWNRTEADFPRHLTVHEAFEQQVARTPDATAVVFEGQSLSYAELNARANRLAHYLRGGLRAQGVGPDILVALCVERSLEMLVGMIGILKAGGAYLPLDPAHPTERLADLLDDAQPLLLLTQQRLLERLPATEKPVFCLDTDWEQLADQPVSNPVNQTRPEQLAYVIYTSGSTGRPKGTLIYHRSVINLAWARIHGIYRPLGLNPMRASFNYSYAFDASVAEFILLLDGHTLYITPEDVRFSPPELVQFFKETQLDAFECTPAQLKYLIDNGETAHLPRFVLFGGDAIDVQLWRRLHEIPTTVFFNTYGPTECTVDAIACRIDASLTKPVIGRPIANVRAYILDAHLNPLPVGGAGELHVGGEGVGYGYLNRPELTAEKFIADPFSPVPGARMYKTGDLARFLPDGNIEFLGRLDHQVKIRGFRVELGDIEAALTSLPGVKEAVAIVREDHPGDKSLAAYLTTADASVDLNTLREALKERLPTYMLPSHLMVLDAMPLTGNGKIDRKALPKPDWQEMQKAITPPANAVEQSMAGLWSAVLDVPVDAIGRESNFFHLGGHSLLATVLFARIAQVFGRAPALRQLFEHPTVAGLTALLGDVKAQTTKTDVALAIIPEPRPDRLPLSFEQQRLWFLEQLSPGTGEYNITTALELRGTLDHEALRRAFESVVHRHEILRSRILPTDQGCELKIDPPSSFDMPLETVALPESQWPDHMQQAAEQEARLAFDLGAGRPLRARLIRLEQSHNTLLLVSLHHTVADDWSIQLLMAEITEGYRAQLQQRPPRLPALPIQFADYSLWQRQAAQHATYQRQLDYWRENLNNGSYGGGENYPGGEINPGGAYQLDLPTDIPRGAHPGNTHSDNTEPGNAAGACFAQLPDSVAAQVRAFAQAQGVTVYMLLLATLKVFLSRYSHQTDIRIGTPVANRRLSEVQSLIGCFVNTLVIRTELTADAPFTCYLDQVKQQVLAAQENQDVPFDQVVEALAPDRSLHRSPLFQVLFVMQNANVQGQDWPALAARELVFASPAAKYDLNWEVHDDQNTLQIMLEYRAALFSADTMQRWLREWQTLLQQILANPALPLKQLSPLTEAERYLQQVEWNANDKVYAGPKTLSEALSLQVRQTPDAPAVIFESTVLSYRELHARANQLANALRTEGIGRETVVGVCVTRSVDMVVALLGIIKAGAAYLPLDPDLPPARLAFMIADAESPLVLSQSAWRDRLPVTAWVWCIDQALPACGSNVEPDPINQPQDLAYVIYTSGSTGQPKGVLNEHGALMNRLYWMQDAFPISPADRVLQKTPYSFDVSVWEFFWPLITGACLVVAKPGGHQDSGYLVDLIQQHGITTLHFVPSMLQAFVAEPGLPECSTLRQVFASGEALPFELQQRFFARHSAALINLYGPTEAAIDVSVWRCDPHSTLGFVPIGRPIANLQLYILGDDLQILPVGAIGELYIGGVGLARGYLNRPELTAERFIPHPFHAGELLYRTGDRCRFLADGNIQYLGRLDHQVKLRGLRIELGEIDAELLRQENIREAVTVLREDLSTPQLVAYLVADSVPLDHDAIRARLGKTLPHYMVPIVLIELPALPLNSNGKLDRKQLPKPDLHAQDTLTSAPKGVVESTLVALWAELLSVPIERIGRESNFFRLGGHSLLATVLLARLRQRYGVTPTLRQVFEQPTLADIAALTGEPRALNAQGLSPQPRPARLPLSFAQQRLWFLEQLDKESAEYNITLAVEFSGALRVDWLQQGLEHIVARHEILRSRMCESGEGAELIIDTDTTLPLPVESVETDDTGWEQLAAQAADQEAQRPFDLANDRLIRARILQRCGQPQALLLLTLHHTVADDWSVQLLIDELAAFYESKAHYESNAHYENNTKGQPPQLPELPVQYVDYSLWQRSPAQVVHYQQQIGYWRQTLEDGDYLLELPTDHPRRVDQNYAADSQTIDLSPELSQRLRDYAQQHNVTPFVLLLALTQTWLGSLANQRDVRVGIAVANRGQLETQSLIGCFVNTLVIRADLDPQLGFSDFLHQVKQRVLEAQEHQDIPFEQVVDSLAAGRDLTQTPLFQVMLTMQNARLQASRWPDLALREIPSRQSTAQFDLDFDIHDDTQQFAIQVTYRRALFEPSTLERWLAMWRQLLDQVLRQPDLRLGALDLMTRDERRLLLEDWNQTRHDFPLHKSYAQLFAERAAAHPQRVAAVCQGQSLTYAELDARASRLAHALIAAGAKPDTLVALLAERGLPLLTMMIAVFKAGAAYLPLDKNQPSQRLQDVLQQSAAPILLASDTAAGVLDEVLTGLDIAPLVLLTESLWLQGDAPALRCSGAPEDLAYVIFTSGSTGTPKGAMVEQRGMLNNIFGKVPTLGLREADRIAQTASPAFDISVWQFLAAPVLGATVHILPDEIARDPTQLLAALQRDRISVLEAVPTVIRGLLESADDRISLTSLRWLLPTGEALPMDLCQSWFERFPHIPLMNAYGPAECSDDVAFFPITEAPQDTAASVPIGRPTANNQLFILDESLRLLPIGTPGEICVGGVGVGRGYLNDTERTRAAFVEHPFQAGERFYRTGDLGRYRADGVIEFLGRRDQQVKVRGHRIELAEIEASLLALQAVADAAVIARRDPRGENQLIAYWVAGPAKMQETELRDALGAQLPHYMVPAAFVQLEKLPLNANGKIDRKALAQREPDWTASAKTIVAPRTDNERILCELLCALLKRENISVTDNFFAVGGDSILGLQLIARARPHGIALTPKQLFLQRTIADLALAAGQTLQIDAEQGRLHGAVPLLPVQHWLFEQNLARLGYWNQSLLMTPRERLMPEHVHATLVYLMDYHDALRMRFTQQEGRCHQHYDDSPATVELDVIQVSSADSLSERLQPYAAGFDLARGPLIRAVLVELPEGQRLYLAIHHLVIDTVSWRILMEEFSGVYAQLQRGDTPSLPAKTSSYRQWAQHLGRYAGSAALATQVEFWSKQGGDLPLPVDHPEAPRLVRDEVCLIERLTPQETRQLLNEAQLAYRTQVPELLLTALVLTLCEWKGDDALTVTLEGHGRENLFPELDLSRTVGWFTSLFPVCLRLPTTQEPAACIKAIKEQLRAVPERGLGYGVLKYLTRAPLPVVSKGVLFNYLGRFDNNEDEELLAIAADPVPADKGGANAHEQELEIVPMVIDDRLQVEWRFNRRRYDSTTQERLLARYMARLRELLQHCLDPAAGGLTPSDFPLARQLNQKSLDKLLVKLKAPVIQ